MSDQKAELAPSVSIARLDADAFGSRGRRTYFAYRDLLPDAGADGRIGGRVIKAMQGVEARTGWHHHELDLHVIYVLAGHSENLIDGVGYVKAEPGTCINIPPRAWHNELVVSDDFEAIEFTIPATFTTVEATSVPDEHERLVAQWGSGAAEPVAE